MDVRSNLQQSMDEEAAAGRAYRERAISARLEGDDVSARLWEHVADEEDGHYYEFKDRLNAIREQFPTFRGSASVGIDGYPIATNRPFPQTDTDWEDLGFDIEAKYPDNIMMRTQVRLKVADAIGKGTGSQDDARRWLVLKAGELGIS